MPMGWCQEKRKSRRVVTRGIFSTHSTQVIIKVRYQKKGFFSHGSSPQYDVAHRSFVRSHIASDPESIIVLSVHFVASIIILSNHHEESSVIPSFCSRNCNFGNLFSLSCLDRSPHEATRSGTRTNNDLISLDDNDRAL